MTQVLMPYQNTSYDYTIGENGLATIPNVDILSVGTWWASTGECTFTEEDLVAFIASLDDPAVKDPRQIIGHTDVSVTPPSMAAQMEGFVGEQPIIGKFTNCRLTADRQTVVADLIGVPAWLAAILPYAYPQRSVEAYWEVTTVTGKTHGLCIPRVALLGTNLPGVATLEDLRTFFSEEGPEEAQWFTSVGPPRVAASQQGAHMPAPAAASVGYEDVRRAFYEDFAIDDTGRYWWWIRTVYLEPNKLIVDDDDGGIWSVPYSLTNDTVTFSEPVKVFTQYVEQDTGAVAASATIMAGLTGHMAAKAYKTSDDSRPEDHNRANAQNEEKAMPSIEELARTKLGLSADAPVSEVEAAINALPDPEDETPPVTTAPVTPAPTTPATAASEASADGVTIDKATWEAHQAQLAALTQKDKSNTEKANKEFVALCAKKGRILKARQAHFEGLMERDPDGTRDFLESIPDFSAIPAEAIGGDDGGSDSAALASEYDESWLSPGERRRVTAARAGQDLEVPLVTQEVA